MSDQLKTVTSLEQMIESSVIDIIDIEIPELGGRFFFRGITEKEFQRLTDLGGKVIFRGKGKNRTEEFDLSNLKSSGNAALFAMGWVDEMGETVIPYKNKPQWEKAVKRLGDSPTSGLKKGAELVRKLSSLDEDEDESDEKKDSLKTETDN